MSDTRPEKKSPKEVTKRFCVNSDEYLLNKRFPNHCLKRDNEFFINMSTDFGVQLKRCQKVLDSGQCDHILIHGLGKAVNRAINMSLRLQETNHLVNSCSTSSEELIDDLEPIGHNRDVNDSFTQRRTVSAIHIKLFRKQLTKN